MPTPDSLDRRWLVSNDAYASEIAGEIVLLSYGRGEYFGLGPIGAEIWRAIEQGGDVRVTVDRIAEGFQVSPSQVEADIRALLEDLIDNGLIAPA